jgi:hypothetical protein
VHFGEVYGDYYRRLLDENEESLATNYSVNMASVSIVNIILDVLVEASAGSGCSYRLLGVSSFPANACFQLLEVEALARICSHY